VCEKGYAVLSFMKLLISSEVKVYWRTGNICD